MIKSILTGKRPPLKDNRLLTICLPNIFDFLRYYLKASILPLRYRGLKAERLTVVPIGNYR